MYWCENCGREFATPNRYRENYGLPGPWYQSYLSCPYCHDVGSVTDRDPR